MDRIISMSVGAFCSHYGCLDLGRKKNIKYSGKCQQIDFSGLTPQIICVIAISLMTLLAFSSLISGEGVIL